jgi:hypothetical protein
MHVMGHVNPFPKVGRRLVEEGEAGRVGQQEPKRGGIRPVPAPAVLLPKATCVCNRKGFTVQAWLVFEND